MKTNKRFFFTTVVMLAAYVLSACGGVPQQAGQPSGEQAAIKVRAVEVAYTGVIEAINGNEWTVNGQVLSVDPSAVRDGPFQAGDTVKVEGEVNPDGSLTILRVEAPSPSDLTDLPQLGDGNTNTNANTNDDNANDNGNENDDDNANSNSNDDDEDDDNANANSNDDDDDDDSNSNGNSNDDDDDSHSNGNSNGSHNGDDDDHGSSGNSNDDYDDSGNSNGDDD